MQILFHIDLTFTTRNESWKWIVEDKASLPDPVKRDSDEPNTIFWEWLFAKMKDNGLEVYKLYHTQQQMPNTQV